MDKLFNYFRADQFGAYALVTISRGGVDYISDVWPDCGLRREPVRFEFCAGNLTACSLDADEYGDCARFLEDMARMYADCHARH